MEKVPPLGKAAVNKGSSDLQEGLGCDIELGATRSRAVILPLVFWKTCFGLGVVRENILLYGPWC